MSSVVMSAVTSVFIVLNSYLEEFDTTHLKNLIEEEQTRRGEVRKSI